MADRPAIERRRGARRQADRDLLLRVQQLQAMAERRGTENKEAERSRRRIIRHTCHVNIEMLMKYASGRSDEWNVDTVRVKGKLLDLSPGGASLFTREIFGAGQELRLGIQLKDGSELKTNAAVRWVKAVPEKGAHMSGVQFTGVAEADHRKLAHFLEELDATVGL